ncbi:Bifunctional protein GlmU [subsurface metagenome]
MTAKWCVSRGVVLAAGDGSRLRRVAGTCPKVLLSVRGKPLIYYPIEVMAAAGINQVAVVVGYSAGEVITALGDGQPFGIKLDYILNQDYYGGNAVSVSKVRAWAAGEPFVLCMGDHMIEPAMVRRLLNKFPAVETLCVDFTPTYCHDLHRTILVPAV